jgi:hypothetical protein
MKIIDYIDQNNVIVEFQNEFKTTKRIHYNNFKNGAVLDNYSRNIFGVGYVGEGEYYPSINKIKTKVYETWYRMLERCYYERLKDRYSAYYNIATVCEEWLCFQTFAKWYYENYYDIGEGRMHLDKDVLGNGSKIYCPENCIFLPQRINMIFMTKSRKDDLPNGIFHNKESDTYVSHYNGIKYGKYNTLEEAVKEHDRQKRIHIKEVVKEYGDKLPPRVREALLSW